MAFHTTLLFVGAGFVQVVKKLEGQGILTFYFSGQESPGIEVWVMESHGKARNFLRIKRKKKLKKQRTSQRPN